MPFRSIGRRVVPREAVRKTAAQAAAEQELADTDYRELQQQAKEAGIPGNQSADALRKALAEAGDSE